MTEFSHIMGVMCETIYALVDDRDRVRYVGRTSYSLKSRLAQHRSQAKRGNQPIHEWLRTDPYVKIVPIQACPYGKQHVGECEADWIRWLRAKGAPILNTLPYPEGMHPNLKANRKEKDNG